MKLLLDTHILLWAAGEPERLSKRAHTLLSSPENTLFFSAASFWEIVIKLGLGRRDFRVDPYRLRKELVAHGYVELPVMAEHVLGLQSLPPIHKDPFDRILLAQARSEGLLLVTADAAVAEYGEPTIFVR
ncbi:MAG: type II toxin-antitoxin system VapC family toxin [Deltaproteobacteria bacterium]|nr:type II toxin-antitoxin system VapC family toxin [Deltaproteobacteria bacterium]MBW2083301.1 type II toxin-antitoxin system VapC family toxin [Deltaproteobacteria bacterium]